jgi:hypothetical protein
MKHKLSLSKKNIFCLQDKSLARLPPEGGRQVSPLSGKTREEITAHYNNKQHLIKLPYVKPYESTYLTNR